MTDWNVAMRDVREHVVRIDLPDSYGSGFHIARRSLGEGKQVVVATAHHVVKHAAEWNEMIRVTCLGTQQSVVLTPPMLEILVKPERDLALLIFDAALINFPDKPLPLQNSSGILPPGLEVGWCGFPNMVHDQCCFFAGHISAPYLDEGDYLADGVAIHGVSGGPVFICKNQKTALIGLISAYIPNLSNGETLPGMSLFRSLKPILNHFRNPIVKSLPSVGAE